MGDVVDFPGHQLLRAMETDPDVRELVLRMLVAIGAAEELGVREETLAAFKAATPEGQWAAVEAAEAVVAQHAP